MLMPTAYRRVEREVPKLVCSSKRLHILREFFVWHFVPIAVSIALLILYAKQVLLAETPSPNALNALQVAAKVHDTLIVASLSTILFHHIRYRLMAASGSNGILSVS